MDGFTTKATLWTIIKTTRSRRGRSELNATWTVFKATLTTWTVRVKLATWTSSPPNDGRSPRGLSSKLRRGRSSPPSRRLKLLSPSKRRPPPKPPDHDRRHHDHRHHDHDHHHHDLNEQEVEMALNLQFQIHLNVHLNNLLTHGFCHVHGKSQSNA